MDSRRPQTGALSWAGATTGGALASSPVVMPLAEMVAGEEQATVTLSSGAVLMLDFRPDDDGGAGSHSVASRSTVGASYTQPETDDVSVGSHSTPATTTTTKKPELTHWAVAPPGAATLSLGGTVGDPHGYLVTTKGEVFSWGTNRWGQLGSGGGAASRPFQTVEKVKGSLAGRTAARVAAGGHHGLAVTTSGTLYGWGRGFEGQTGLGNDALDRETLEK